MKLIAFLFVLFGAVSISAQNPPTRTRTTPPANVLRKEIKSIPVSSWFNTGMMLENLQITPSLRYFDAATVGVMIPADWEPERRQLASLDELKKIELASPTSVKPNETVIGSHTTPTASGPVKTTVVTVTASPERTAPPESIAIGQSLVESIKGRLSSEPLALWYFDLGRTMSLAFDKADSHVESERQGRVEKLREFLKTAPAEVTKELITEIGKLSAIMEKGIFTPQDQMKSSEHLTKVNFLIGMTPSAQPNFSEEP